MPEINEVLKTTPEVSIESQPVSTGEIINRQPEAKVPAGLETFLQRIEKDPTQQSVVNDANQPQLTPANFQNPKIIIPITRTTFVSGFKKSFDNVGLWLSHFFFREIKLKDSHVFFKPDDS